MGARRAHSFTRWFAGVCLMLCVVVGGQPISLQMAVRGGGDCCETGACCCSVDPDAASCCAAKQSEPSCCAGDEDPYDGPTIVRRCDCGAVSPNVIVVGTSLRYGAFGGDVDVPHVPREHAGAFVPPAPESVDLERDEPVPREAAA